MRDWSSSYCGHDHSSESVDKPWWNWLGPSWLRSEALCTLTLRSWEEEDPVRSLRKNGQWSKEKLGECDFLRAKWGSHRRRERSISLESFSLLSLRSQMFTNSSWLWVSIPPSPFQSLHLDLFPFSPNTNSGTAIYKKVSPLPLGSSWCFSFCPWVDLELNLDSLCEDKKGYSQEGNIPLKDFSQDDPNHFHHGLSILSELQSYHFEFHITLSVSYTS